MTRNTAPIDKMPVSALAAAASFLLFLPSCPSAAINPGLGMPWVNGNGDVLWEDDFYSFGKKPWTTSMNPRLTWLGRGPQPSDVAGPMQKRGGGVAVVRRHPSAALSLASRKRQQFMAMPYHPLARFRGVDSSVISTPMIGPYRPSPPFALPLGVSSYGPRTESPVPEDDVADDEEIVREAETGALSAGQLLSLLSAVARDRGLGEVGRINKGLRFGLTRRR